MPRIVQCPKCRAFLQEPPPGNPYYQCGSCSTTLQAKHATQADLEASKRRMIAEQQRRNSLSDPSSDDVNQRVVDELSITGNRKEYPQSNGRVVFSSPVSLKQPSYTEMVTEDASYMKNRGAAIQLKRQPEERVMVSYMESRGEPELDFKQLALGTETGVDYVQRRAAHHEIGGSEHWSSNPEPPSYANSSSQEQRAQVSSSMYKGPSMRRAESVRSQSRSGTMKVGETQTHISHRQLNSSFSSESMQGTRQNYVGEYRHYEANGDDLEAPDQGGGNITSGPARSKLRWQARDQDSADELSSPDASLKPEDDHMAHDVAKLPVSVKEATSVEYVVERNWRTLGSRRRSFEDRRPVDDKGAGQLVRSGSESSDQTFDMYENPACIGDYEPSESSSTVDDAENNQGILSSQNSGEIAGYSPPFDQVMTRSASRPNLPRSNASSGRSGFSEETTSYNSQIEMSSPDNPIDHARMIAAARRHSWDERVSRMGSLASNSGQQMLPTSLRQKSVSQDYGSSPPELLQRASSDSGWNRRSDEMHASQAALYDSPRQPLPTHRPQQQNNHHQQWINRYTPVNRSSRSHNLELSPLHPLQGRASCSCRQIPVQGQLPPKQGQYPPLPPPGALPHVSCQHCGVLLAVPINLPPPKRSTQKLRCGACMKISTFSVQQSELSSASRSDTQVGQSLLAPSPDFQGELTSGYRTVTKSLDVDSSQTSGRSLSNVDAGEKRVQGQLPRGHSLNNEEMIAVDEDIVERALAGRAELLTNGEYTDVHSTFPRTTRVTDAKLEERVNYTQKHGGNDAAEDKLPQEIFLSSSDSESDLLQRTLSASGSPQVTNSSSRSPPPPYSPPLQDVRTSTHSDDHAAVEQVQEVPRGLNKTLKGIFSIKSVFKQANTAGHYRRRVVVNGVAIPDHLVKKAEEQAGPIHPGTYWYDSRAGFWGVEGGPCLGIIPPFIEEFQNPMSRDCSGGRTGILVNGRELHHKDREKLSGRGLPDTPGMSYQIEIDGRVIEETMGSELRGLGRLAPTLEQKGRGTGMYVPPNVLGAGSRS